MVIQILHIVRCLWAEERQSLCKSLLSIHCNRPSAHLLSVEDIFLLSWQDAFNQETARAMSFPLLWYQSFYCTRCLPRLLVCLTAPDQGCTGRIWSPRTSCTSTRRAGGCPLQVLVYHLDITTACIAGWTCQRGSKKTAGTPPSAFPPLTHRGTKCWKISGIRWGVCFTAKATQGVQIKVRDRFQELAWPVSVRSNNHFDHRAGLHKLWQPGSLAAR